MRRRGADLEEKPEPRAASSAGAQEGWLHEGRGLTPAAIEKPTLAWITPDENLCKSPPLERCPHARAEVERRFPGFDGWICCDHGKRSVARACVLGAANFVAV